MSNFERPEFQALRELEEVAERVAEELNVFRVRAQTAEAERDKAAESGQDAVSEGDQERTARLESDNRELQQRVEYARDRVGDLLARLDFLEEQISTDAAS